MLHLNKMSPSLHCGFNSLTLKLSFTNGDLQLISGVDQLPHLEFPYPLTNGGQQLRHASGRCPVQYHSVTLMT